MSSLVASSLAMTEPLLEALGRLAGFYFEVARTTLTSSAADLRVAGRQIVQISLRSFSTVLFAGVFVGAILVLQFNQILAQYDAQALLGGLNTSATVRQVGPLIISFLLAGKIGAFTTAELGTMRVTEQIDAIECLGVNPVRYLVVPRFIGIVVSSVILLLVGLLVSLGGSIFIADWFCGINVLRFLHGIPRFTTVWTFMGGFFQCIVYGMIVAGVSTWKGFSATGGARGVGRAVTMASVTTNLLIVIANFLTSRCLDAAEVVLLRWGIL